MESKIEEIARRLVVGRKRDGRGIYDPRAKTELVEICRRSQVSTAKLASRCGINANLLATWLRQAHESEVQSGSMEVVAEPGAFVAVPMTPGVVETAGAAVSALASMAVQVRLPNGVTFEVQNTHSLALAELIETLGRLRCSASTKG